ncbi:MAG: hypothetical protein AAF559_12520 [Pseudomonadota bacterium]
MPYYDLAPAIAEGYGKVNTINRSPVQITYQQRAPNLCLGTPILVFPAFMSDSRIDKALARIDAAVARIDTAREGAVAPIKQAEKFAHEIESAGSANVTELVNRHEKLREEVAESLRDLDALIEDLEG